MAISSISNEWILSLADIFTPLNKLEKADTISAFLSEFGWLAFIQESDMDEIIKLFNFNQNLKDISTILSKTDISNISPSDIKSIITDIKSIYYGIKGLSKPVNPPPIFPFNNSEFWSTFSQELIDYLLIRYLRKNIPSIYFILKTIGILSESEQSQTETRTKYIHKTINWDRIPMIFSDIKGLFSKEYRCKESFSYLNLLNNLSSCLNYLGFDTGLFPSSESLMKTYFNPSNPDYPKIMELQSYLLNYFDLDGPKIATIRIIAFPITPRDDKSAPPNGIMITPTLNAVAGAEFELFSGVYLKLEGGFETEGGIRVEIRENGINLVVSPSLGSTIHGKMSILKKDENQEPIVLLGSPDSTRLEYKNLALTLFVEGPVDAPDFGIEVDVSGGKIVISGGEGDNFLQKILPKDGIESEFNITLGWSSKHGIYFRGSAGLEIALPIHQKLGPIYIETIYISIQFTEKNEVNAIVSVTANAKVGPIAVSIEKIGLKGILTFPNEGGNLGPLNLDLNFKPPDGAGFIIDAAGIGGGGYLKFDNENKKYAGILQLNYGSIGLDAIALITTKMPNGENGFSILISICTEFKPPIQLPWGFTLSGVGGLIGINRTMQVDVLRDGIRNRALNSILFPQDPILNASKIISDMEGIFPAADKRYIIGPMVKLGWGNPKIINADIGIFIEIPQPVRVVILGQLAAFLPEETAALIELHIDAIGVIEFEKKQFSLDMTLYDSRILQNTLSGDAAIRSSWGDQPQFAMSLGGFHPKFSPPPGFPQLKLLTFNVNNGSIIDIRCKIYQALTPNSLQFGAKAELLADAGPVTVEGYLTFDTLIYFSPFSFDIDMSLGLGVKWEGYSLAGVNVNLNLSGPSPWHARGHGEFEILWWDIDFSFEKTWGQEGVSIPSKNPREPLIEALKLPSSWGSTLPKGSVMVETLKPPQSGTDSNIILVHPAGTIQVMEKVLPLGMKLQKFGNAPVSDYDEFSIALYTDTSETTHINQLPLTPILDFFARGQFEDLSNDQKLSVPCFEKMQGGISAGMDTIRLLRKSDSSQLEYEPHQLEYESILLGEDNSSEPQGKGHLKVGTMQKLLRGSAAKHCRLRTSGDAKYKTPNQQPKVAISEEGYSIVQKSDLKPIDLGSNFPANDGKMTRTTADTVLKKFNTTYPNTQNKLQVVVSSEAIA